MSETGRVPIVPYALGNAGLQSAAATFVDALQFCSPHRPMTETSLLTKAHIDCSGTVRVGVASGLAKNVVWLYAVHSVNYLLPLVLMVYLARVLGPGQWGVVAFTQAFGQYLTLLVQYGFDLSATKEVARCRDALERRADLLAGVLGAKVMLAFLATAVAFVVWQWFPVFREHPTMLWTGVFWAVATGFSFAWYFQGLERMQLVAILEIGAKVLGLLGVLALVKGPEDGPKVLASTGAAALLAAAAGLALAYREIRVPLPSVGRVLEALRLGWSVFVFRAAATLYTVGNPFILGLFAGPHTVAYYVAGEKLCKGFVGLFGPISQAVYARLSHLAHYSPSEAAALARKSLRVAGIGGIVLGLTVLALGPFLVRSLLGVSYEPAVASTRILALLVPLIAVNNVLGIQWMLPLGLAWQLNGVILSAGVLNLTLAGVLASRYAHKGMALAVVASEAYVTCAMWWSLARRGIMFWGVRTKRFQ